MSDQDDHGPDLPALSFSPDGMALKEGERRTVTVLFSDMKGFTALSERSDPEEMDTLMTRVFSRFEGIVRKHGGYVEKYIGDAMVAVFGLPEIHEDDAARAIDSALEFYAALRKTGSDFPDGIQFRTGIHSGLVATGKRGSFDVVTGHTLAVASRLQSSAPPNGVLVSQAVRDSCDKLFVFSDAQSLSLKGKEERVLAYQALARRKAMFDYTTPFVDRKEPLELLTTEYVRHMRGESRGVYIVGDGGIGKTRLVAEFWARLKGFPDFRATFLAVNPSSFGNSDYSALLHAAADFLDVRSDASFEEFSAAAREHAGLAEEFLRDAYGLWKPSERPAGESRFAAAVAALYDAMLASDGDRYPDVVFVDNARATDERSLEFFRGYFARAQQRPFVVLCDRMAHESAAAVFGAETRVVLEPLGDDDAAALARALGSENLDEDAIRLIVDRAQGYPLFIEEYVKLVLSSRDASTVPESIQTTILAALDRLDPDDRALAQQLSVLRFPFTDAFAAELCRRTGGDPAAVPERLARLVDERVLTRGAEGAWTFKHGIVKDAVYSSLLIHNRRVLHSIAAELLRDDKKPVDVFYHLAAAENWSAARAFLVDERPALPLQGADVVQTLIDHCPPERLGELIELHFIKYATYFNNRVYDGLGDIVQRMYRLALRARKRFYLARCYHLFMTTYYMDMDYRSAVLYGRKALDAYEGAGNERGASNARYFLSFCYLGLNEFDEARAVLERIDRSDGRGETFYASAMVTWTEMKGEHADAVLWNGRLIALAESQGDEDEVCKRRAHAIAESLRDFSIDDVLGMENAGSLFCGFEAELAVGYYAALGLAYRLSGDDELSSRSLASADYHLAQARNLGERAHTGALLAWARLLAGQRKEARATAQAALETAALCGNYSAMFSAEVTLAELAFLDGDRDEFAFFVRDASPILGAPVYRDRAVTARWMYFAWILLESGADMERAEKDGQAAVAELRWEDRDDYLAEARRLLDLELDSLPTDACRERCVSLSVFGRIARG
ncbi:MAG: AAA family ATPase [Spirochaetia bacterium]|nr:AAA family ATPase [Spirochaetia bacterium]